MKYLKSYKIYESTLRYPQHAELSLSLIDDINDLLLDLSDVGLSVKISNESTLIAKKTSDIELLVKSWDWMPGDSGIGNIFSDSDIAPDKEEVINGLLRINDYMESKGYKYLDTITGRHRIDIPLEKRLRYYANKPYNQSRTSLLGYSHGPVKPNSHLIRITYRYVNCIIPGCECKELQ